MLQKAKGLWNNYQSALHFNIMSLHMEMLTFPLTGPCEKDPAVDYPDKGPVMHGFGVFFFVDLSKLLNK